MISAVKSVTSATNPDDPCIHIERHGKRRVGSRQHQDQHRVKAIRDCNRCNCAERRQQQFSVTS